MHHLQRSGKMLGQSSSSCQSFFLSSKNVTPRRLPSSQSAWLFSVAKSLYILLKPNCCQKVLKPLHAGVFILFVLLVGCASTRQTFTQSLTGDDSGQPDIGVILSLADFHFDPFYDPKLFAELVQAPASEWTRIFDGSEVSGYGEYGKDSNYNLIVSALKYAARAAPKVEFILLAGDWLAHGFSDSYYQYAGNRDPQGLYEFIDKP
jgi:hypothetical protein